MNHAHLFWHSKGCEEEKMFLPTCHIGQKLDPDPELELCYKAISKMAELHAGVRVLASALLARTESCLAVGHPVEQHPCPTLT